MKAKLKTMEVLLISMVIMLNLYLVHLNIVVSNFNAETESSRTANYIQIEYVDEKVEQNKDIRESRLNNINTDDDIVYDGKTLEELSEKLNKSLNSTISGKGYLIASYSLQKGVDPYLATAIILQETGCKWECSRLVYECNNVGGQKGYGCGSYSYFDSIDEGIIAFIDNLYINYISYGLTTPETINPKYAESTSWAVNVNNYIESIKAQ